MKTIIDLCPGISALRLRALTIIELLVVIAIIRYTSVSAVAGPALLQLFGVTVPVAGQSQLVRVDPLTGHATTLFAFPLTFSPGAMCFYPPTAQFVICTSALDAPRLAFLNPRTQLVTEVNVAGLPAGLQNIQGVEFYPAIDGLVVTFGPTGTYTQDHLAAVASSGQVTQISQTLPFPDADFVAYNPSTGLLNIVDLNSGPGVQSDSDPFGTFPVSSELGPNLGDANFGGPTFSPDGQLFILHDANQSLLNLSGQSFVTVGPFGNSGHVINLAFGSVGSAVYFASSADDVLENAGVASVVVTLGISYTNLVTVDYATSDGTATAGQDYAATNGTLTFSPGQITATVNVPIINNSLIDGSRTVNLTLSRVTGGVPLGTPAQVELTINSCAAQFVGNRGVDFM